MLDSIQNFFSEPVPVWMFVVAMVWLWFCTSNLMHAIRYLTRILDQNGISDRKE
jgi:hypothetical protein